LNKDENSKSLFKSKTFWAAISVAVLLGFSPIADLLMEKFGANIYMKIFACSFSTLMIFLRIITTGTITWKK